jgi:hypothetical protein
VLVCVRVYVLSLVSSDLLLFVNVDVDDLEYIEEDGVVVDDDVGTVRGER